MVFVSVLKGVGLVGVTPVFRRAGVYQGRFQILTGIRFWAAQGELSERPAECTHCSEAVYLVANKLALRENVGWVG